MKWWCAECEDEFDEPTAEGNCPLCGHWCIQDEDGVLWVQKHLKEDETK